MNVKLMKNFAPKVYIDIKAMNKMKEYVRQSSLEIGWLGTCKKLDNIYYIDDVFLFRQEVHATTTEITVEGLNEFAMELLSQENGVDIWNNMKVWGHSHVNMATSPSGQDDKQIEVFSQNADDFFIRIIANKSNDFRIDLYDYTTGVIYEKLGYEINYGEDSEYIDALYKKIEEIEGLIKLKINPDANMISSIKSEIKEKVTEKKTNYNVKSFNNSYYGDYGYYGNYNEYYNPKKKEKSKEEEDKVADYVNNLTQEEIFDLMYYMDCGMYLGDLLDAKFTSSEITEIQDLIEDYVYTTNDEYAQYLGYTF